MTTKQLFALHTVEANGPLTAAELDRHTMIGTGAARSMLARLERHRLVEAHDGGAGHARAYIITERGEQELAVFDALNGGDE